MCISSAQYRYVPGPGGGEPEALVGGVLDTRVNRGQELHQTLPVRHHMHLETRSSGKCNKFKKKFSPVLIIILENFVLKLYCTSQVLYLCSRPLTLFDGL